MYKKVFQGIGIGIFAAVLSGLLHLTGSLSWLESKTWDWRVRRMAVPAPTTDQIRLILIDQTALDWGKESNNLSWPWPRQIYAPILEFCRIAGAKAVVFDMIFSEPSYLGVEDDILLGEAIALAENMVGAIFPSNEQGALTNWPDWLPAPKIHISAPPGFEKQSDLNRLTRALFPIPEIATNAALLGGVYADPDPDAIIRRTTPVHFFDGQAVPSLGLAAFLVHHPEPRLIVQPGKIRIDDYSIPLDSHGRAILRYRGPSQTHAGFNAAAIIQSALQLQADQKPSVDPELFRGRYVFLGVTAPALMDLKPTPISKIYPGMEIHATFLDNLLNRDFITAAPPYSAFLLALLFALLAGISVRLCRNAARTTLVFLVLTPLPLLLGFAAYSHGYWMPVATPGVALLLALVGGMTVNYAVEGRQKQFIKGAFKQYLSPAVIERLTLDPSQLRLGGELRELSIFFSDVQGFTSLSESLSPQDLTALLNDYLTAMTDIIMEEGGTVDKYEGDAIIAFWNAPLDVPLHAECAVRAALRNQKKLAELRPAFRERAGRDLFCRIGVNTGRLVVGNMGSQQRFDYTFLGDAGNLASRLEGINKQFGTPILISHATRTLLSEAIRVREVSRVRVVGRNEPVVVYEPMFPETFEARKETLEVFGAGLQDYYAGKFADAVDFFTRIENDDPVARAYLAKCAVFLKDPPSPWDGVWTMTEK